jgi:molybdopterin-guanine dinucleotide biosynthesis protein A
MTTTPPSGFESGGRVPVYVLAGGKSRRYGSDKARVLHRGVPLMLRVAETLAPLASSMTVVAAKRGAYEDLGLRTIGDVVQDRGPLGGLLTAIEDRGPGWLFLSACDWIGLRAEWARGLVERAMTTSRGAVAFRTDRWEPLFALYNESIREDAARIVHGEDVSMHLLLEDVDALGVDAPSGWANVINLNHPQADV